MQDFRRLSNEKKKIISEIVQILSIGTIVKETKNYFFA